MKYVVDVDGTICTQTTGRNYWDAVVWPERVAVINQLYDEGHTIVYFTARGMGRFTGDPDAATKAADILTDLTKEQLESWGCKFHDLSTGSKGKYIKPACDMVIDDKAKRIEEL